MTDERACAAPDPDDAPLELAELQDETIDDAILRRLFEDLDALAEIREVQVKGAADQYAQDRPVKLREALGLLLAGRVRGAQVLYEYDGRTWCDTVIRQSAGHRLIRIETPRRAASVA